MPSDEGKDNQVQQDKVTGNNSPFQGVIRLVIPSHITLLNTKFPFPSAKIHIIFVITKKNPRNFAGIPLPASQPPYPPCPKEDLEPLSKPLANRWQEDVTDSGGPSPGREGVTAHRECIPNIGSMDYSMRQPIKFHRVVPLWTACRDKNTSRVPAYQNGRTDGAARGESSSLRLSRVVTEEDVVKTVGFCGFLC